MIDPIFLAEAAVNGILLGGILALLALGLNLIFGVIDIVWIVYVDLVMLCMYGMYFLVQVYGWPVWAAGLASRSPSAPSSASACTCSSSRPSSRARPSTSSSPPAGSSSSSSPSPPSSGPPTTRACACPCPPTRSAGIFLPAARLIPFAISIVAMVALYLFLTRTYMGTAIRAVSQDRDAMRLMGANPQRVYIVTSAVGGLMAGLAGALLIFQYSVHPFFGGQFGPLTFMICVLGGLGNMVGAFIASFIMSEIISIAGVLWSTEMGYVIAFVVFIVMIFARPGGIMAKRQ